MSSLAAGALPALLSLSLPLQILGAVVLGCAGLYLIERFITGVPYPPSIPLVREPEGARRFSLRTRLAYYTDCRALFEEAWYQHLKHGRPVVIPGLGSRKEVILPPGQMRWALSQSEDRLSVAEAMAEVDQARWSLGHAGPVLDSWQGILVKTELNRALESVCAALSDELERAFDAHFGTDTTNWREFDLRDTVTKAIAQANSRFTVGAPLCRDPEYLQTLLDMNDLLITVGSICSGIPHIIRPVVGSILGIPMTFKARHIKKWLVPLWKERVGLVQSGKADGVDEPKDHVQMMARFAVRERPEELEDYNLIIRRISAQNFGAVHQTAIQVSNLLLNIIASDGQHNTIAKLLEESDRILSSPDPNAPEGDSDKAETTTGRWTKTRVNRMVLADSASRETLRLNSFANRSLIRKVIANNVETPDGHSLPRGTIVSFLSWPAQTDAEIYDDPLTYDPFRFSRPASGAEDKKPQSFVTTSPDYLSFGHGKHACPGRFIVDFELKMIIGHVLRYYDVRFPDEYKGKRPPNEWICEATFPPAGVRVCMRRKEKPGSVNTKA